MGYQFYPEYKVNKCELDCRLNHTESRFDGGIPFF